VWISIVVVWFVLACVLLGVLIDTAWQSPDGQSHLRAVIVFFMAAGWPVTLLVALGVWLSRVWREHAE